MASKTGELSEHSKSVAKGSFWSLAGSVFLKLTSFLYVIILARVASQDDVGIFYLALAVVSIINTFSDLGISGAFIRYVPYFEGKGEHGKIKDLLRLSYTYLTILSLIITIALFLGAGFIGDFYKQPQLVVAIQIMSLYTILGNLFRLNYVYLQGITDIKGSQLYQNLQNLLKLILTVGLFYIFGATVTTISWGFILSFLITLIASSPPIYRAMTTITAEAKLSRKELLEEIIPLGLLVAVLSSFSNILFSADRLILGYFVDASHVAIYTFATTLAGVLMTFPGAVGGIFLPVVSKLSGKSDFKGMREVIVTSQRWSLFITLPIAVVMMAFAADMLRVFYGTAYESGALVMSIATLGLIFSTFSYALSLALTANRMVKIELIISGVGGLFNVILCALLIPAFGMEGAAVAGLAALIFTAVLLQYYGERMLEFKQPIGVYKLLLAAVISFALIMFIKPYATSALAVIPAHGFGTAIDPYLPKLEYLVYLGVLISLSGALFIIISLLLKCFHHEDVTLMRKALRRALVPHELVELASKVATYGVGL